MSKDWTQGTVNVGGGIELFYTRTGKGEKPAIVLAHGITDNGLCWGQLAADLEANYDLIMYDAYGHGNRPELTLKNVSIWWRTCMISSWPST